jgi:ABC-type lipoprotein export system ATPase subunit
MKIKQLHIADFNQFKDFSLNLTYPDGHEKKGEPLDKICIIGQSGTGKTTLLNLILKNHIETKLAEEKEGLKSHKIAYDNRKDVNDVPSIVGLTHRRHLNLMNKDYFKDFIEKVLLLTFNVDDYDNFFVGKEIQLGTQFSDKQFQEYIYYFSTYNFLTSSSFKGSDEIKISNLTNIPKVKLFDLNDATETFWRNLSWKIKEYQEEKIKRALELQAIKDFEEFQKKQIENEVWVSSTKNPLKELGEGFLDKILNHFNLRVKTELEFSSKEDIGELKFETIQGKEVTKAWLSTGTKQLVNTMLPIYADKPQHSVLLFDEPERSLYPDIQLKVVDFYTSLASTCQFFFATHSPLIASCFEPWEIVELKFNEDGTVYQEVYYDETKGRHVANYFIHPKRLKFGGILTEVFDLKEESNAERIEKLMDLSLLERKIKTTSDQRIKKELWEKYENLAQSLNWEIEDAEN